MKVNYRGYMLKNASVKSQIDNTSDYMYITCPCLIDMGYTYTLLDVDGD
jgi:hypothetical protein